MNIYTKNLVLITLASLFAGIGWSTLVERYQRKRLFEILCAVLSFASIFAVFAYTVWGRETSARHILVFAAMENNDEFFREMFMNALLYFPFGLAASPLLGGWSLLFAFSLSFAIETWQYFSGAGIAQGTDVIMNSLGALFGILLALPHHRIKRKK